MANPLSVLEARKLVRQIAAVNRRREGKGAADKYLTCSVPGINNDIIVGERSYKRGKYMASTSGSEAIDLSADETVKSIQMLSLLGTKFEIVTSTTLVT